MQIDSPNILTQLIVSGSSTISGSLNVIGTVSAAGLVGNLEGTAESASFVEFSDVGGKPSLVSGSSQVSFTGIVDKPSLVSGSSQIELDDTTGFSDFSSSVASTFSGLSSDFGDLENKPPLVSGSSQISFDGIVDKPALVSGSSQVSFTDISDKPTLLSGSSQVSLTDTDGFTEYSGSVSSSLDEKVNTADIINDLTTGGATKVLSAEQGVEAKSLIDGKVAKAGDTMTGDLGFEGGARSIGTEDANDLILKTNNTERGRVKSSGHVIFNDVINGGKSFQFPGALVLFNNTWQNTPYSWDLKGITFVDAGGVILWIISNHTSATTGKKGLYIQYIRPDGILTNASSISSEIGIFDARISGGVLQVFGFDSGTGLPTSGRVTPIVFDQRFPLTP